MEIVFKSKNSISLKKEDGETKGFMKITTNEDGVETGSNPNFSKEIDKFAGEGFYKKNKELLESEEMKIIYIDDNEVDRITTNE